MLYTCSEQTFFRTASRNSRRHRSRSCDEPAEDEATPDEAAAAIVAGGEVINASDAATAATVGNADVLTPAVKSLSMPNGNPAKNYIWMTVGTKPGKVGYVLGPIANNGSSKLKSDKIEI